VTARLSRFGSNDKVPPRDLTTARGDTIRVPDQARPVHLQFRRYAACPVCNLHLRTFARRHEEIVRAGVIEIAVFHSPPDDLRGHDLPFALVADPTRVLYREFGVEKSVRSVLDPRAWGAMPLASSRSEFGFRALASPLLDSRRTFSLHRVASSSITNMVRTLTISGASMNFCRHSRR
jgi:AhpC/TSA family